MLSNVRRYMPPYTRKWHSVVFLIMMIVFWHYLYSGQIKRNPRTRQKFKKHVIPILVMACDRPSVKRCLESVIKYRPSKRTFPIIVSQDCRHEETYQVIKSFADQDSSITIVHQPDQSDIPRGTPPVPTHLKGYYRVARHYKFALNYVFRTLGHKAAIILEDDLEISSDFYEYFIGTYPLLYKDPSIWCVSAWNDNCKLDLVEVEEPELLHRTDFFPGLGWMLLSKTWDELERKWPEAYFDDWLRNPAISRGRVCIRPEISRTINFGREGVSNTRMFDLHLKFTILNQVFIPFSSYNLQYLFKRFEPVYFNFVYSLPEVTDVEVMAGTLNSSLKHVRVPYTNNNTFEKSAKMLGLMYDLRHGVPRTGLRGVVTAFINGRRVYLAPKRKGKPRVSVEYSGSDSI